MLMENKDFQKTFRDKYIHVIMNFGSLKSNRVGNTMDKNLKMIDLFSGGGGFSSTVEKLVGGYETIQTC